MGQNDFEDDKRKTQYHHPDAITDEALDWFVHLRDEPVVPETLEAFEQWRADDPKRAETYAKIEHLHEMPSLRRAAQKHTSVPGMVSARNSASPARGAFDRRWFGRVAAATAVLVLTIGISQAPELKLWWQADYTTGTGQRATFELPDGSRMMLNTASAVSLDFDGEQRRVTLLKGEAYFDVRPGADPTFIVSAGFSKTKDLGTSFIVRRGAAADTIILERGRVDVSRLAAPHDETRLDPGQMVVASGDALSGKAVVDMRQALAWLEGRIIFRAVAFADALASLRPYSGDMVVEIGNRLNGVKVSGNYNLADPEAAIRTMAESAGATVTRLPGGILLLR